VFDGSIGRYVCPNHDLPPAASLVGDQGGQSGKPSFRRLFFDGGNPEACGADALGRMRHGGLFDGAAQALGVTRRR